MKHIPAIPSTRYVVIKEAIAAARGVPLTDDLRRAYDRVRKLEHTGPAYPDEVRDVVGQIWWAVYHYDHPSKLKVWA